MTTPTHVEKRASVQTRPRNLAFASQHFQIPSYPYFCTDKRLGHSLVPRTRNVTDKLIGKEQLDTCSNGSVDHEARCVVLRGTARDAVYDCVLVVECGLEGCRGGVIGGFVRHGVVVVGGGEVGRECV